MARGKGSLLSPKPVALPQTYNAQRGGFAVNYPLSKKEQKKRIDHDPRLAKKILIVDFGFDDVPQVIPPGVVWTIFGLLLLPIL